jgi:hypothetical protein
VLQRLQADSLSYASSTKALKATGAPALKALGLEEILAAIRARGADRGAALLRMAQEVRKLQTAVLAQLEP